VLNKWTLLVGVFLAVLALGGLAACGGDNDSGDDAAQTDGAFIAAMTEHHEAAVEMAQIAEDRAEHSDIRRLAGQVIDAQTAEINHMGGIHEQIFDEPLSGAGHGSLGMSAHEMGMDMEMTDLEDAMPFDRAFIDAMIAHHQGAIRMARVELEQGSEAQLHDLCNTIIEAQSHEIEQMNDWRERWYGAPSPAGGVPLEDESLPGHEMMDH
jgi:uncharacterized protein (DUF305 family)